LAPAGAIAASLLYVARRGRCCGRGSAEAAFFVYALPVILNLFQDLTYPPQLPPPDNRRCRRHPAAEPLSRDTEVRRLRWEN